MDWGLVEKYIVDEVARLSAAGTADGQADALASNGPLHPVLLEHLRTGP